MSKIDIKDDLYKEIGIHMNTSFTLVKDGEE